MEKELENAIKKTNEEIFGEAYKRTLENLNRIDEMCKAVIEAFNPEGYEK